MDRLKYFLFVALLAAFPLSAQQNPPGETVVVNVNTNVLLTGETLYCKLYCQNENGTASAISRIAYAELIDSNRKSVARQKWILTDGIAQGDFFIPTTLPTGSYKLIAYTQWMLNVSAANFFETNLAVVNPFQPLAQTGTAGEAIPAQGKQPNSGAVAVQTDAQQYGLRSKVNLTLKNLSGAKGKYSVSVRQMESLPAPKASEAKNTAATGIFGAHLPELRGELVTGKVVSKNNKSVAGKTVALSIPGKSFAFKLTNTDKDGRFTLILDKNPLASSAVIQVLDENRNDFSIALDPALAADVSGLKFDDLLLNPEMAQLIEQKSIANQIGNAYYQSKKDSLVPQSQTDAFYHPLEKRYVLDDYTRFPSLRETITEVILEMYSSKSGGKSSIHLRNTTLDSEAYGQPLILVDGLLIQDTNELYDYNPENIYAVDLVNFPYVYGPKTFSGLANFITKNTDYETKSKGDYIQKIDLARPAPAKIYFAPDYSDNRLDRIPDYRHQLLWQPDIVLNQAQTLSFFTSDVAGKFEISVQGFTQNGDPVLVKEYIEVK